tara:strand:- start:53054 stop:53683 length:630 start_codon:yes stop_codon:yes gene_type:complete
VKNSNLKYKRKNSLRLKGFDYSTEGIYFITISSKTKNFPLSTIVHDTVVLTPLGKVIENEWLKTPKIRTGITLGNFIIMPDHFHALIMLHDNSIGAHSNSSLSNPVGAHSYAPLQGGGFKTPILTHIKTGNFKNKFGPQRKNLSSIVRGFKGACTKKIRETFNSDFAWQRSFHDRIVRDQKELERVEDYIINNPLNEALKEKNNQEIFH